MFVLYLVILFFGLIVGSFLGVCIYRLPKDESIIKPASHCAACKKPLKWFDNIPLLSFLLLKGKCRYCKVAIPPVNFIVELISGVMSLYLFWRFGFSLDFLAALVFFAALIVASFIDLKYQIIPDCVTVSSLLIIFVIKVVQSWGLYDNILRSPIISSLGGAIFGGGLIYLIIIVVNFILFDIIATIYKKRGKVFYLLAKFDNEEEASCMGLGDVTLMVLIGSFLGVQGALLTFVIAPFIGSIIGVIILATKKDHIIPYGPFLSLAALIVYIWQDQIMSLVTCYLGAL
jgi:leader peptidase (prepilin peptidase)/N-methyltransferase